MNPNGRIFVTNVVLEFLRELNACGEMLRPAYFNEQGIGVTEVGNPASRGLFIHIREVKGTPRMWKKQGHYDTLSGEIYFASALAAALPELEPRRYPKTESGGPAGLAINVYGSWFEILFDYKIPVDVHPALTDRLQVIDVLLHNHTDRVLAEGTVCSRAPTIAVYSKLLGCGSYAPHAGSLITQNGPLGGLEPPHFDLMSNKSLMTLSPTGNRVEVAKWVKVSGEYASSGEYDPLVDMLGVDDSTHSVFRRTLVNLDGSRTDSYLCVIHPRHPKAVFSFDSTVLMSPLTDLHFIDVVEFYYHFPTVDENEHVWSLDRDDFHTAVEWANKLAAM